MASPTSFILSKLAKELHEAIYGYLESDDIKNLRATCSAMANLLPLSFNRVFISANSLNLEVFYGIANDETLYRQVTEIVWDDARLATGPELEEERKNYECDNDKPDRAVTENGCPLWFKNGTHFLYQDPEDFPSSYEFPHHLLNLEECWSYYKTLLEDQHQVLASNADIEAFKFGVRRFPSLKRVTVTPATHGRLEKPLYRTPMIRAFPRGFDYPLPESWPCSKPSEPIDTLPWASEDDHSYRMTYGPTCTAEAYRAKWRGYQAVTQALTNADHQVTELHIGGHEIGSGISCRIFDQHCVEYEDLVALIKRPGFKYLNLDVFTGLIEHENWDSYRTGLLYDALAQAKDIEHISFRSTSDIAEGSTQQLEPEEVKESFFPLRIIFPIEHWPQLRHFGISHMLIQTHDLINLLTALPRSLRSVELSHLAWSDEDGGYDDLLYMMRDTLNWQSRPVKERPKVHMAVSSITGGRKGYFVEVDEVVHSFLYGAGDNPFIECPYIIYPWEGGIWRDMVDAGFKEPYDT